MVGVSPLERVGQVTTHAELVAAVEKARPELLERTQGAGYAAAKDAHLDTLAELLHGGVCSRDGCKDDCCRFIRGTVVDALRKMGAL